MSAPGRLLAAGPAALVVAVVCAVQALGLAASPQRGVDEAVAVASAGHLLDAGLPLLPLSPAWWQLAAAAGATGALDGAPGQVEQGRWLVLGATAAASLLLWVVARRLGLGRTAAAAAVAVAGLSPLAVALHRTVSAENIALPWALAALALLLPSRDPRRRRGPQLVAGCALAAVALATSPTVLLLAPLALLPVLARRLEATRAPTTPTAPGERRSAPVGTPRPGADGAPGPAGTPRGPSTGRRAAVRGPVLVARAAAPAPAAPSPGTQVEDAEVGDAGVEGAGVEGAGVEGAEVGDGGRARHAAADPVPEPHPALDLHADDPARVDGADEATGSADDRDRDGDEPAPGTRAGAHRLGRPRHGAPPRPNGRTAALLAGLGGAVVLAGLVVGLVAADAVGADLGPVPAGTDGLGSSTRGPAALQTWIALDVTLPVLLVVLAALSVRFRRWRVPALGAAAAVVGVVVAGLPASSVVVVLVPGALLVGAAVDRVVATATGRTTTDGAAVLTATTGGSTTPAGSTGRATTGGPRAGRGDGSGARAGRRGRLDGSEVAVPALAGALALLVAAAWVGEVRRADRGSSDAPVREAIAWVQARQDAQPVLADPAAAPDLVAAGVAGVADLGADGSLPEDGPAADAVAAAADGEVVWVLVTDAVRAASATSLRTSALLGASGVAETFGEGDDRVELRVLASAITALAPEGADGDGGGGADPSAPPTADADGGDGATSPAAPPAAVPTGVPAAPAAARAIAANPALDLSPAATAVLADGPVDSRLLSLLATLVTGRALEVTDLPLAAGQAEGDLRRSVVIAGIDGAPLTDDESAVAALVGELDAQTGAFVVTADRRARADDPRRDELLVELAAP